MVKLFTPVELFLPKCFGVKWKISWWRVTSCKHFFHCFRRQIILREFQSSPCSMHKPDSEHVYLHHNGMLQIPDSPLLAVCVKNTVRSVVAWSSLWSPHHLIRLGILLLQQIHLVFAGFKMYVVGTSAENIAIITASLCRLMLQFVNLLPWVTLFKLELRRQWLLYQVRQPKSICVITFPCVVPVNILHAETSRRQFWLTHVTGQLEL